MASTPHSVEFAENDRFVMVAGPGWTLQIDATGGHPTLIPRGQLRVVDDLLLLFTEGEHRRSGAGYLPQVHRLTGDGRVLWSLRARCVGDPVRTAEGLLLPVRLTRSRLGPPVLHVQLRDVDTGALLAVWPVRPPPVLEPAYAHALAGVGARLVTREGAVQVAVSAWFTGPHAPPRGAGGFDVLIAL
ncbi:MAG TPA: hypothetical protein VGB85_01565 [Nannocystis sp.]|jgi:hypothetical protein